MTDKRRKNSAAHEKRRQILNAAIRVFAQKGFHRCRISDIASEAKVAYGLVYHYFENKEEILNSIFDENWGLLTEVLASADQRGDDLELKLRALVDFILDAYRMVPDVIQVMVMEIARSSKFLKRPKVDAFEKAFQNLAVILARAQSAGLVRTDLEPKIMAYMVFGSIELILTGYLLGTIEPNIGETYEAHKKAITDVFLQGLRVPTAALTGA
jgi:TetR/AcrR family transcriptional regulator, fatty acid metabolism regulator protein